MKVVKAKEMARIEQLAYQRGASEEQFMLRAGEGIAEATQRSVGRYHLKPNICLLCGRGNNGGDAYVAGAILIEGGFHVTAISLAPLKETTLLSQKQSHRFAAAGGEITVVERAEEINFGETELILDGILGTGFRGQVEGLYLQAIKKANASGICIISIDIPSGVDGNTGEIGNIAINATETIALGLPKTGCFLGEVWNQVGKLHVVDFGLDEESVEEAEEDFILIDDHNIKPLLPPIKRTRHKYQAGYVVGLGGSPGMPGAPTLASFAALRAGAGIVRLLHPKGMEAVLSGAPYELVREGYEEGDERAILDAFARATATFVGPGIGASASTIELLKKVLPRIDKPCVIDADALTLLAAHDISLPPEAILTPHHGEMQRLLKTDEKMDLPDLLKRSQEFADRRKVTLVLKGAPTFIFHPGKTPTVCGRGDPGLATAGTGDVLTGVIAAFLAQGKAPLEAASLGVYFQAVAGEYAAEEFTSYSLIASDVIDFLPVVFEDLR